MDIYASDEEKAEAIKQWWRENGLTVFLTVILSIAAVFSGRYWVSYQQQHAETAAVTYHQVVNLLNDENTAEADTYTQNLLSEYADTPYSVFAAMQLASNYTKAGDVETAKTYLKWVIENAKLDGHQSLAKLRLANLLLNESQFEEALNFVESTESAAFGSLFSELKGDIFIQQAKQDEAKKAYLDAIAEVSSSEPRFMLLQMKIDDLS